MKKAIHLPDTNSPLFDSATTKVFVYTGIEDTLNMSEQIFF